MPPVLVAELRILLPQTIARYNGTTRGPVQL